MCPRERALLMRALFRPGGVRGKNLAADEIKDLLVREIQCHEKRLRECFDCGPVSLERPLRLVIDPIHRLGIVREVSQPTVCGFYVDARSGEGRPVCIVSAAGPAKQIRA